MKIAFLVVLLSVFQPLLANSNTQRLSFDMPYKFDFKVSYIQDLIKNGVTCQEIINYFLERAHTYNSKIRSIINYNPLAVKEAIDLDTYYKSNSNKFKGSLHCVPVLVKDNIDVKGMPTTGAVTALRNSIPNTEPEFITRLRDSGAIIIAKANMGELASGVILDTELGGLCRNPYDLDTTCSGSSSGNAAGVSAGLAVISIGSDTDSSILVPSDYNNLYGLRPAINFPSLRNGYLPGFLRLDTIGPMTKYLEDTVLTYSVLNNLPNIYKQFQENFQATSLNLGYFTNFFDNLTIPSPTGNLPYQVDPTKIRLFNESMAVFRKTGINVKENRLTNDEFNQALQIISQFFNPTCYYSCMKFEMNNYFSDANRFGPDAPYNTFDKFYASPLLKESWKNSSRQGATVNNPTQQSCDTACAYFDTARTTFIQIFDAIFQKYNLDSIAFITTTKLPYKHGQYPVTELTAMTFISSYLGYPALSVPIGFSDNTMQQPLGLPVGIYLLSKNDKLIHSFRMAKLYQQSQSWVILPHTVPLLRNITKESCKASSASSLQIMKFTIIFNFLALTLSYFKN